jgi:membrane protein implicated in regulation of membrane protease activity
MGESMTNVYFWLGLGLMLMALETFVPGVFLIWFGIAALVMAAIVWLAPEMHLLFQVALFGGLAVAAIFVYKGWFKSREPAPDQPLLNQRAAQLVGRIVVLESAIENGYGKVRIGDALWTVTGAELPAGARVVVTGVQGMELAVRRAD